MKQCKPSSTARKAPVFASLALACVMTTTTYSAHASIPASDWPAFGQRLVEFFQSTGHRIQEVIEWKNKLEELKKQIPDLSQFTDPLGLGAGQNIMDNLTKRPLSYGIERCDQGGGGGFDIKSLLGGLLPTSSGNYVAKQKDICQKIVTLENAKNNDLVDALTALKEVKEKLVDENRNKVLSIGGSGTQGAADTARVSAITTNAEMELLTNKIEITTMVYDGMIESLNQDMKNVASEAMNGKKKNLLENVVSTVTATATMKIALDAQESPCPSGFDCDSDIF